METELERRQYELALIELSRIPVEEIGRSLLGCHYPVKQDFELVISVGNKAVKKLEELEPRLEELEEEAKLHSERMFGIINIADSIKQKADKLKNFVNIFPESEQSKLIREGQVKLLEDITSALYEALEE